MIFCLEKSSIFHENFSKSTLLLNSVTIPVCSSGASCSYKPKKSILQDKNKIARTYVRTYTHIHIPRSLYTHKDPVRGSAGDEKRRRSKACNHECLLSLGEKDKKERVKEKERECFLEKDDQKREKMKGKGGIKYSQVKCK